MACKELTPTQVLLFRAGKWKGVVLGEYEILDLIGSGGMGLVFRAVHRRMDRVVALKVLSQETTASLDAVQRFQREVKAGAKLTHPNIVTAYDAGEHDGVHYLVMEYIDGITLARRVRGYGPLPLAEAVDCILQAARGLEHAHGKGVIHRDVKPANLLVTSAGTVKILDLGLARLRQLPSAGRTAGSEGLTQVGVTLGTADYMAPEQALDASRADHRADIYSLGGTLHYLLTGRPLYSGDSSMERLLAHRESPIPSLRASRPEVAEGLDALFQRLVAKKPEERFSSMSDVIAALSTCLAHQPLRGPPSSMETPQSCPDKEASEALGLREPKASECPPVAGTRPGRQRRAAGAIALVGLLGSLLLLSVVVKADTSQQLVRNPNQPEAGIVSDRCQPSKPESDRVAPTHPGATLRDMAFEEWRQRVAALPAEQQVEAVTQKLRALNPSFDGKVECVIDRGLITSLGFLTDDVTDIAPVQALAGLRGLRCNGSLRGKGRLFDLSPLKGMRLKSLCCSNTSVSDLSPLKETQVESLACLGTRVSDLSPLATLKLKVLFCGDTRVADLSPLKDMPLTILHCGGAPVWDLSPVKGMKLSVLVCGTKVTDLSPLEGMPLQHLGCAGTLVSDLSPLRGMALEILNCNHTQVADLSPLRGMPLKELDCTFRPERDGMILRSIKTLKRINGKPAAKFWKEVDDKKLDSQR
jgi:serine/threonine protein kinase